MKKNLPPSRTKSGSSYSIPNYGHDRTVHSLGLASNDRRRGRQQRAGLLRWLAAVLVLTVVVLAIWQIWPLAFGLPGKETTRPTTTGTSEPTSTTTPATGETTAPTTTTAASTTATLSAGERTERLAQAAADVTALLENKAGRFAVSFRNLASGETWDYHADQPFVAASSIKMGINTYLYTKIAAGEISPDEQLAYDNRTYPTGDYESGTGSIQYEANGTRHTVRDTSRLSIRISDNCGTNMIIRRLGGIDLINSFLKGISHVVDYRATVQYTNYAGSSQSGRHRTSSADLAAFAVRLYELWQDSPAVYDPLLDDLSNTEFAFGIQKGIPATVRVAHKIGTNGTYSAENDVGIVFAAEPFVLCVMTEMASASAAHQAEADVAAIFYTYIESLRQG